MRRQRDSDKPLAYEGSVRLDAIGLPFMDLILAERFLLPPESLKRFGMAVPETVAELCDATGMDLAHVNKILQDCVTHNQDLWLGGCDLDSIAAKDDAWIVDMRPGVSHDEEPLHPAARIFHLGNQAAQLGIMRTLNQVIVLSHSEGHAWSAAMGLRSMGVRSFVVRFR